MPELPEVGSVVRTLISQVQGKRIGAGGVLLAKSMQGEAALFPLLAGGPCNAAA